MSKLVKRNISEVDIANAKRLKAIWEEKKKKLGLNQLDVASRFNVMNIEDQKTQGAISQYLNGTLKLNLPAILIFSKILEVQPEEIDPSLSLILDHVRKVQSENVDYIYPLISSVKAGEFFEVLPKTINDAEKFISTTKKCLGFGFWLLVDGDSMTAPSGYSPSFPSGMMILVDTGLLPDPGQFCVAIKDDMATFKRYVIEEGIHYLKPLNPDYKKIPIDDNCRVIGKVIEARWEDF